jgi:hypothetical protein
MSKNLLYIPLLLIFLSPLNTSAQSWKKYRKQYILGVGAANFLGDLGGRDQIGTNWILDLELPLTRPAFTAGYKYQVFHDGHWETNLNLGWVRGDDNLTAEPARQVRNLKFKSPIVELSTQFDYYILKERSGHLYKLKGIKGQKWKNFNLYAFAGIGLFYFNPKGPLNGSWVALQPLGTEGQGLNGTKKYSRINFSIPYGIGIGRALDRQWNISLEIGMRKTFTDYIDDVSGNYYDNNAILQSRGATAAYFADPTLPENKILGYSLTGEQRGDPSDKDAFMFAFIKVGYKVFTRRRHLPKF